MQKLRHRNAPAAGRELTQNMSYELRTASPADAEAMAPPLDAYVRETYGGSWGGSIENVRDDLTRKLVRMIMAECSAGEIIGFIAAVDTYDLHWCVAGTEIIDLYVDPRHRGRGVALLLAIRLANETLSRRGSFLKGGAVDNAIVRRFYDRITMTLPGGESYLSGRAFRHFAGLEGRPLREIVRDLPDKSWNTEP
jgi:GNAT superfamily N-acetyltransferase